MGQRNGSISIYLEPEVTQTWNFEGMENSKIGSDIKSKYQVKYAATPLSSWISVTFNTLDYQINVGLRLSNFETFSQGYALIR